MLVKDLVVKDENIAAASSFEVWLEIYGGYIV
jgi:hypothetical protein